VMAVSGAGPEATVHVYVAGVVSVSPPAVAATVKVCVPFVRPG